MRMVSKQCLACNREFEVRFYLRNAVVTCCKACSNRLITLRKIKGIYLQCDMCDKLIYKERTKVKKHNFCSLDCDYLYRRTVEPLGQHKKLLPERKKYYGKDWGKITRKVRNEQNYICNDCGISEEEYGKQLSVHHIIPFVTFDTPHEANKRGNLVGVCEECHRKRHSGEHHIMKLNPEDLGKNAYSKYGETSIKHREQAREIVNLLLNSNKTLQEISDILKVSYTTVRRIYIGQRWQELYDVPPIKTNPRAKAK